MSCQQKAEQKEPEADAKPELVMYKPSEMANFMNALYAYNLQLKHQIVNGEVPTTMPLDLMKLHSAEMSKGHQRTAVWNNFVNVFIESQQTVVDTLSNTELKARYNAAINNCLACHKTECTGPIPKIKKLLIQ
ncbi:hypothetical protein [Winogradskyella sp.]|uniref:hypothetical protein n=1 Tax=Winogradskyella sp. TaxID=1883156 RepID=UPI00260FAA21|nr:hypothetical protein [Winogradskyella sp.]